MNKSEQIIYELINRYRWPEDLAREWEKRFPYKDRLPVHECIRRLEEMRRGPT